MTEGRSNEPEDRLGKSIHPQEQRKIKEIEEKWIELQRSERQYKVYQHTCNESSRRRKKRHKRIKDLEKLMAENIPNLKY